ncbi:hypothetical protein Btru_055470 [Bulinus truncatus]|nr:hypothetical protein Btru_055470 [Bulinus truncatus]
MNPSIPATVPSNVPVTVPSMVPATEPSTVPATFPTNVPVTVPVTRDTGSDMEEDLKDPLQLSKELVLLIVEARTPDVSVKGRVEGPHCPVIRGRVAHKCTLDKIECIRASEFCYHTQQLCQNNIPICLDIMFFPECHHGMQESLVTEGNQAVVARENSLLIERWTIDNMRKSDIAAGTAAALAAGSIVFKGKGDTAYSNKLLSAAKSLYAFAKSHRGLYKGAAEFYDTSGDKDVLCEASVWLHRATKQGQYLTDARSFVEHETAWAYSWDDKQVGCHLLMYEETKEKKYRDLVTAFFRDWMPGGSVAYTPCGLAWRAKWGSTRYAGNSAFIALVAAEAGINPAAYRKWAVEQINYLLGDNRHDGGCFSFEVGYGKKYPLRPHHAGASCPNKPAACGWPQFQTTAPNPHILHGALVGGPDEKDNYSDVRSDYIKNEVTSDYNSGFQGALAGIIHLQAKNQFPTTNNKCPCKE